MSDVVTPADLEHRRARVAAQRYSPRPLTEGEVWTAEVLAELRRCGYRPSAWRRFLGSSLQRSRATRHSRPVLAAQARRWGLYGALAWLGLCRACREENVDLRVLPGLAWWLVVWQMLDWHLGMAEGGDGQARIRLSSADAITLTRFWLVPTLPAVAKSPTGLPAIIIAGGVTDWLDGALARRHGRTRLGRDLDTTADLAFFIAAAVSARSANRMTPAACWAIVGRAALGVALASVAVFARARRPAIRARAWGAVPRTVGLGMLTAGSRRLGTATLLLGCIVPPRSTASHLSPV